LINVDLNLKVGGIYKLRNFSENFFTTFPKTTKSIQNSPAILSPSFLTNDALKNNLNLNCLIKHKNKNDHKKAIKDFLLPF
jgi:hypothetical protein